MTLKKQVEYRLSDRDWAVFQAVRDAPTPPDAAFLRFRRLIRKKAMTTKTFTPEAPSEPNHAIDRLIPLPELLKLIPVCRVSIHNMIRKGMFPAPLKLTGSNRIAWRSSEIAAWIAKQPRTTPKSAA